MYLSSVHETTAKAAYIFEIQALIVFAAATTQIRPRLHSENKPAKSKVSCTDRMCSQALLQKLHEVFSAFAPFSNASMAVGET